MFWLNLMELHFSLDLLFEGCMILGLTARATRNRKGEWGEVKSTDKQEPESLGKET